MSRDPGTELLNLATEPDLRLGAVLDRALQTIAVESGADAAALLVFDPAEIQPTLVAAATWGLAETAAELFFHRSLGAAGGCLEQVCGSGLPQVTADHPRDFRGLMLSTRCRSSLWLPLLEHRRAVGLLVLEASRPGVFADARVRSIGLAAHQALPGLQRALLRHWLLQAGAPVDVVGMSPAFLDLERQVRLAGTFSDGAVLVTGERGSGKELVAWAIHAWSRRRKRPFVPLLGAACAETLTADELFGHERHAFTGAVQARMGKFQAADGGTLLLDEAGDLPPAAQASFLRVLERGELQRIGCDKPLRVNVRVIAATNRDLTALMADGRFRHDLYDRLSFFEVKVPPLRERSEDIPLLARHFMRSTCSQTWRHSVLEREGICGACAGPQSAYCATPDFFNALLAYRWPGNVRELRQVVTRLVGTVADEVLDLRHLPDAVRNAFCAPAPASEPSWNLDTAIRRHIEAALQHTGANQSEAARLLGLPLSTLRSKILRLGIVPPPHL
ncbi:MAG: sigma 54-interacting transcriptional regulator [Thermoanaerobaculia bacterium]